MPLRRVSFLDIGVFLDKWLRFQNTICKGCHDILIMSTDIKSIIILYINGVGFFCIIFEISKCKAIILLKNAGLNKKSKSL